MLDGLLGIARNSRSGIISPGVVKSPLGEEREARIHEGKEQINGLLPAARRDKKSVIM